MHCLQALFASRRQTLILEGASNSTISLRRGVSGFGAYYVISACALPLLVIANHEFLDAVCNSATSQHMAKGAKLSYYSHITLD